MTLTSSYINPETSSRALKLLTSGRLDVTSMIVGQLSLDEMPAWFADPERGRSGKFVVLPNGLSALA